MNNPFIFKRMTAQRLKNGVGNQLNFLCINRHDILIVWIAIEKMLTFYCASSIYEFQKESTTPVAKAWDGFYSIVYVFTYMNSRSLRLYDLTAISYDGYIENRMFQQ